jgi:YidC/Oxa1 family membrane protein insertase
MAKQMKMMNNTMPVFMAFMCFITPVGLGIYWIAGAVCRIAQQFLINKHMEKVNLDDIIAKNQEKAKKKREKMGIAENQINNAARMSTRIKKSCRVYQQGESEQPGGKSEYGTGI